MPAAEHRLGFMAELNAGDETLVSYTQVTTRFDEIVAITLDALTREGPARPDFPRRC